MSSQPDHLMPPVNHRPTTGETVSQMDQAIPWKGSPAAAIERGPSAGAALIPLVLAILLVMTWRHAGVWNANDASRWATV